ncbi:MAG TPA: hypothetical protein VMJ93_10720 [Verrucomicrobiae bacterium]|nr:hypothetical protein [Verrucomicrobiae bacterium]
MAFVLACLGGTVAEARVGVVLNESLDTSLARITGAGHTAVYFSRICPASPVKLRLCRPGEEGSVISNYTTLGEDSPYEWNVVPLSIYLYGVENPENRPLVGSEKIKNALEERYREKYLEEYCENESCRTSKDAEWREMVAATLERSLYIFSVDTTLEQDKKFIEMFNAEPNVNHFNGVTRNCATFTARILNWYYPHSVTPEYLNDFGMSSPKAMARSLTHYALKHPELQFDITHFAQAPGTIKRSSECRDGTEQLYHSKKLLVPMLIFADHELAAAAATYWLTGRFNPVHEAEWYPNVEASQRAAELQVAERDNEDAVAKELREEARDERELIYGTPGEWRRYRDELASAEDETVAEEWVGRTADLNHTIQRLNREGRVKVEPDGSLWLEIAGDNERMRVGISASNILGRESDARLAYELLLDRDERVVKSPPHSRESMREFRADWRVLEGARKRNLISFAREETPGSAGQAGVATGARRAEQFSRTAAISESGAGN